MKNTSRIFGWLLLASLALGALLPMEAQNFNADEAFARCRQLAVAGEYGQARVLAQEILERHPEYLDVRVYLGRIYGWEGRYDSAYLAVDEVLAEDPAHMEAHAAGVDVAYWKNDWEELIRRAETALAVEEHQGIREKYDIALLQMEKGKEFPEIIAGYYYDHFSEPYVRNWHMVTLGNTFPLGPAKLIPSVNGGYSASVPAPNKDIQLNLDLYTAIGSRNSFYVGYGFSPDGEVDFMPLHRAGAELWQTLPKDFGVSAGIRFFYWTDPFTFLTFSGEKYYGDYYFSLRTYLFFKEAGVSGSYYLGARRYLSDKDHYLGLTLGYGTAPDEPVFVESDLDRQNALSVRGSYAMKLKPRVRMEANAGYSYEAYDTNLRRHRFDLGCTFYFRWKKWNL